MVRDTHQTPRYLIKHAKVLSAEVRLLKDEAFRSLLVLAPKSDARVGILRGEICEWGSKGNVYSLCGVMHRSLKVSHRQRPEHLRLIACSNVFHMLRCSYGIAPQQLEIVAAHRKAKKLLLAAFAYECTAGSCYARGIAPGDATNANRLQLLETECVPPKSLSMVGRLD
jgi:hypothetical protein